MVTSGGRLLRTNKCAQPTGHFQCLGDLLSKSPDPNLTFATDYQVRKFTAEKIRQLFRVPFSQMGNLLVTNNGHMQSKKPSFVVILGSSACARLLVHFSRPLIQKHKFTCSRKLVSLTYSRASVAQAIRNAIRANRFA